MLAHWKTLSVLITLMLTADCLCRADDPPPDASKLLASLTYQEGTITLPGGLAGLRLPAGYRYLNAADTRKVIVDLWGNPPDSGQSLGMILPAGMSLGEPSCWAVILTWSESGYIKDDDAARIDYAALLRRMQASVEAENGERIKAGYPRMELLGWALPPRYDREAHKLYWAKELKFGEQRPHTLNYNIRMLGRRGVLELTAVADMNQLDSVYAATPQLLKMVDFQQGQGYVDFDPSTDKVAGYGLAALVAGGVAAKTGLLKGLLVAILAAKKFLIVGAIAAGAFLYKYVGRLLGKS